MLRKRPPFQVSKLAHDRALHYLARVHDTGLPNPIRKQLIEVVLGYTYTGYTGLFDEKAARAGIEWMRERYRDDGQTPRVLVMADHPRTFQELVDAMDPAERERLARDQSYRDPAVERDFHADVWFAADRRERGVWRVKYQDDDGGCCVTIFSGPATERRARDYFEALQSGRLNTIREVPSH